MFIQILKQSFNRFMRGRQPQTILTDMDPAIIHAVANELPNTKHVISLWHILSKMSSWFSIPLGSRFADFRSEFETICYLERIEEFEHQWNHLVARYELVSDKHMALLYTYREYWLFCYTSNYFLARAATKEFLKSMNSFLKQILSSQACLQGFFDEV